MKEIEEEKKCLQKEKLNNNNYNNKIRRKEECQNKEIWKEAICVLNPFLHLVCEHSTP